jgi:UDP-N-acetylglucosamine transferase subunit ALG13
MIFVTVGEQMPFDRLVKTVDDWAYKEGRNDVYAQIGKTSYKPRCISYCRLLSPVDFRKKMMECSAIISHAGMGTIISALEAEKPIVIMPRFGNLHETRNDHQIATAKILEKNELATVAYNENQLKMILAKIDIISASSKIRHGASDELLLTIKKFINSAI